jgi:hypothetical protein
MGDGWVDGAADAAVRAVRAQLQDAPGPELKIGLTLDLIDLLIERYAAGETAERPDLARQDRDEAIGLLAGLLGGPATDPVLAGALAEAEVNRAGLRGAIAQLLGERYEDSGPGHSPADLAEAIWHARAGLRECTAADQPEADRQLVAGLQVLLGLGLADRFAERAAPGAVDDQLMTLACADRDEAISCLESSRRQPSAPDGGETTEDLTVITTLGHLYRHRCNDGPPSVGSARDRDTAISLLTMAASLAEPDWVDVTGLALLFSDRYDDLDGPADRDAFISWGHRLLAMPEAADDDDHADLRAILAGALLDRSLAERPASDQRADREAAIEHLTASRSHPPRAGQGTGRSVLGSAGRGRFGLRGGGQDDRARPGGLAVAARRSGRR